MTMITTDMTLQQTWHYNRHITLQQTWHYNRHDMTTETTQQIGQQHASHISPFSRSHFSSVLRTTGPSLRKKRWFCGRAVVPAPLAAAYSRHSCSAFSYTAHTHTHASSHTLQTDTRVYSFLMGWGVGSVVRAWTGDPKVEGSNPVRSTRKPWVFSGVKKVVLTRCWCAQALCVYTHIHTLKILQSMSVWWIMHKNNQHALVPPEDDVGAQVAEELKTVTYANPPMEERR